MSSEHKVPNIASMFTQFLLSKWSNVLSQHIFAIRCRYVAWRQLKDTQGRIRCFESKKKKCPDALRTLVQPSFLRERRFHLFYNPKIWLNSWYWYLQFAHGRVESLLFRREFANFLFRGTPPLRGFRLARHSSGGRITVQSLHPVPRLRGVTRLSSGIQHHAITVSPSGSLQDSAPLVSRRAWYTASRQSGNNISNGDFR